MLDTVRFRAPFAALELAKTIKQEDPGIMLDVGGGHGVHSNFFRSNGLKTEIVDIIDGVPERVWIGDFIDFKPTKLYDYVWASHVLEHTQNPGLFIKKLAECARPGGIIAVTVPPLKSEMTFGHVGLWNAGLLLINFIKCGIDCTQAKVSTYGYNVSIIVPNNRADDDNYPQYLPATIRMKGPYFDGDIANIGFSITNMPTEKRIVGLEDLSPEDIELKLKGSQESGFFAFPQGEQPGAAFLLVGRGSATTGACCLGWMPRFRAFLRLARVRARHLLIDGYWGLPAVSIMRFRLHCAL